MSPGKHPVYEIIEDTTAPLPFEIVIRLPEGKTINDESAVGLCAAQSRGFLEGVKADLENSVIGFEELSEGWGMDPEWRQAIVESIA